MLDGPENHGVLRAGDVVADQELLVELLRRPQSRIGDLDIAVWVLLIPHGHAHEMNHALRQIADAHGLAHIEHEYFAALGHRPGLDDQLRRLRDGHEVANDFGVSDGYRTTRLDLLIEERNHRAR